MSSSNPQRKNSPATARLCFWANVSAADAPPLRAAELAALRDKSSRFHSFIVEGCAAWLECRVRQEPTLRKAWDLFVADVVAAWADGEVTAIAAGNLMTVVWEIRNAVAGGHAEALAVGDGTATKPVAVDSGAHDRVRGRACNRVVRLAGHALVVVAEARRVHRRLADEVRAGIERAVEGARASGTPFISL